MREGKIPGQEIAELPHTICHCARTKSVRLGVGPHEQRQPDLRHPGQQAVPPQWRAFAPWRCIATLCKAAWVTEPHRNDCDTRFVVECVPIHGQPLAEAVAGWIIPRNAGRMDFSPRRLSGDQQPSGRRYTEYGTRPKRQFVLADAARPGSGRDLFKSFSR